MYFSCVFVFDVPFVIHRQYHAVPAPIYDADTALYQHCLHTSVIKPFPDKFHYFPLLCCHVSLLLRQLRDQHDRIARHVLLVPIYRVIVQ